jgi:hypothetical protein
MKSQNWFQATIIVLAATAAALTFSSCASQPKASEIKEQAKAEPSIESPEQMKAQLRQIVAADATVTEAERNELNNTIDATYTRAQEIDILSNQKKSLLMKELLAPKPSMPKINAIKKSLYAAQKQRIDIIMQGIDQAAKIMRVHPNSNEPVMNTFMRQMMR